MACGREVRLRGLGSGGLGGGSGWYVDGVDGAGGVVLLLVADILGEGGQLFEAGGDGGIAALPFEDGVGGDLVGDEMRGGAFEAFDEGGNGEGGGQAHEQVDVIGDAAERED